MDEGFSAESQWSDLRHCTKHDLFADWTDSIDEIWPTGPGYSFKPDNTQNTIFIPQ